MLNLKGVFKLVDDGLTDGSLAQQNDISNRSNQLGLHVLSEFGHQVNALIE